MSRRRIDVAVWTDSASIIVAKPCIFKGATAKGTANTSGVILYDNASAGSGTKIGQIGVAVSGDTAATPPVNVRCENGIYASPTNAECVVYYELED